MKCRIGRSRQRAWGLAILLFTALGSLCAQPIDPPWLLVERGEKLLTEGEYGRALQIFRMALQTQPGHPEALYGIGRAYKSILDFDIAVRYLSDAIAVADQFEVAELFFSANYELAEIYRVRRNFAEYERVLYSIVDHAPWLPEAFDMDDVVRTLRASGLDRTLVLYRVPQDGSQRAHSELAELLVGLGRNAAAIRHSMVAVSQQLSVVIGAAIARDPTYEFSSVEDLFSRIHTFPEIQNYLDSGTLPHDLYYLAAALWAQGAAREAREVWGLSGVVSDSGEWATRSRAQALNPKAEPPLVVE